MIEFKGLEELEDRLRDLENSEALKKAMGKACALVEGEAKKNAPKDTGALRRSITSKVDENGEDITGIVFTSLEYAPYIEYGTGLFAENGGRQDTPWHYQDDKGEWHKTSGLKPQPFMRPALDENREEVLKIIQGGLLTDD